VAAAPFAVFDRSTNCSSAALPDMLGGFSMSWRYTAVDDTIFVVTVLAQCTVYY